MKLNKKQTTESTINKEGGLAYDLAPKERLFQRVLTCFFGEKKFYGNQDKNIISDIVLVAKTDPEYVLKLASYARNEMNLRTIPQVMLVEAAQLPEFKGNGLVKKYTKQIVQRADEITEVLAYQLEHYKKPIPNSIIRGLKEAFHKFDAYQLTKYKGGNNKVKMKDAIKIVHPKPQNDTESVLYRELMDDKTKPADTWEHKLMTEGASKESWEKMIPKMGYMAILRNLRNFLKHDVDMVPVKKKLTDIELIKKSKQYPFRFYSAYKEIKEGAYTSNSLLGAIDTAMELSITNLPKIGGKSFLSSDLSGSMESNLSTRSNVSYMDIGCLMQAIALNICDETLCSGFGQDFKTISLSPKSTILDNMEKIRQLDVGHSTNGYKALQYLNANKINVDRIMIFTDEEMYDSSSSFWGNSDVTIKDEWNKYKKINSKAKLYVFNLAGYGTTAFPPNDPNVVLISGWTERILNFVELFESNRVSMLEQISSYNGPK